MLDGVKVQVHLLLAMWTGLGGVGSLNKTVIEVAKNDPVCPNMDVLLPNVSDTPGLTHQA